MRFNFLYMSERPRPWAEEAAEFYMKRITAQVKFSETRVSPQKRTKNSVIDVVRAEEWGKLEEKISSGALLVLLDERGQQLDSKGLSSKVESWQLTGRDVYFVIAGADGVNQEVRNKADFLLGLSRMTLPHELARVLFLEQFYRAWTILNNHPYHRV
ncbi:MAG: 23S rRNA (pseudouridine(1915)-N(3))-methyltransferase RlmH [Gammaproteobacteria bacterium]|jgi:23S rRNA (pseudouridine1915-N3)-methyltransferase|nr:23S rRNA (pseudouridine(1915)-N(3))-methyltransferase RlmH [Gammaproteobacteria bacterium]|tara:strand:- start:68047 stop:68517 length:471 start_codon:yes stop_codon:yes gene_type:complete